MKTRIFSLILVVLMLASAVMMTGCSYSFRGEDYSEELGGILTLDSYKNLAVEVSVTEDQDKFLDAYDAKSTDPTLIEKHIDAVIADSMRSLYYTNSDNKKVYFTGTPKLGNATDNDDVKIYYYVTSPSSANGVELYTNLGSNAGYYQLGSGGLIGGNFDTALIAKGISAGMGSLDRLSVEEDKTVNSAKIADGYDALYITVKATYGEGESQKNYDGLKGDVTYRFDLALIDMKDKTLKTEYVTDFGKMAQYKDEFIAAVIDACNFAEGVALDAEKTTVKEIDIDDTNNNVDDPEKKNVTFTVVVKEAQKEVFADGGVEFTFESSNTKVPQLNGQKATVQFIVEGVNEYSLNADLTEYMTAASINEFKTLVQKLDSSFSTDKTDKNEIVAAYREHYETSTHETIMKSIETQAKEAMLTLVLEKAAASFNDEHYPSRAVDDTYDEKLNNYKYAYKSLSDTDAAKYATLEEYIIYKENAADYADAEASMLADSKRIVLEKMVVIHTANLYGIEVTKDDYEAKREEIINSMYIYLMLGMSEDDIIDQAGGKDGVYLAIYYTRAMERVYADNKDKVTVTVGTAS